MKMLLTKKLLYKELVILWKWINENIYVRKQLRRLYERKATITTKVVKQKRRRSTKNSNILIGQSSDQSTFATV
jgi:hypothetical protein